MNNRMQRVVFTALGVLFFIAVSIYAYTRFGRYIDGPLITESSLEKFQTTEEGSIEFKGTVKNVANFTINNREITLDDQSHFKEVIVLSPGENMVEAVVTDSFEKSKNYFYTVQNNQVIEITVPVIEAELADQEILEIIQ